MKSKMTDEQLAEWNEIFAPGHPCYLRLDSGEEVMTRTRSPAWKIGGGFVLVSVEGKTGGWDINRLKMLETHKSPTPTADKPITFDGIKPK